MKKSNWGKSGSRRKLAAACRNVPHRANVPWRKRSIDRKRCTSTSVIQEDGHSGGKQPNVSEDEEEDTSHDWKLWKTVKRCSGKLWDWSSGREHSEFFKRDMKKEGMVLVERSTTSENKEPAGRAEAGNVEAPAPSDNERKKKKKKTTTLKDLTEPYQGVARDERPQGRSGCSG
jgi:hypothetical protein